MASNATHAPHVAPHTPARLLAMPPQHLKNPCTDDIQPAYIEIAS